MKRKLFLSGVVVALIISLAGCGAVGMVGTIYTGITEPVSATANNAGSKVGRSSAISVLGIIATGDAGINVAARSGNITKISHVDQTKTSILGLYTKIETVVYGE